MDITIAQGQELGLSSRIARWGQQRKEFLRNGEPMVALTIENWLFGAECALEEIGLYAFSRLAKDAQDDPVAEETGAAK